ncbi:MAG: DUF5777 family beta-barrel protein [Acidobacteria bacterium]|nr:DUF5777 family beta-barrel protein [Acidobacteriota bacterium]
MTTTRFLKLFAVIAVFSFIGARVQARPEYLKIFASDPYSRPELRTQCTVCHLNPDGGGERNEFGKAFTRTGLQVTPELRKQFPDRFLTEPGGQSEKPPVKFVEGSDSEAIVELNGKRYVINTREKTVKEFEAAPVKEGVVASNPQQGDKQVERPDVYRPVDVRVINLPSALPIPKGSLWTDFTHRFPLGDPTDAPSLFGLDTFAVPSFGFIYGLTDRIQIGAYRAPTFVDRPIELYAGAMVLSEQEGDPFSLMARVGVEGRDNFQRNFTTSIEFAFARSITRNAQVYFVPTISLGDRPFSGDPTRNLPGEDAFALGIGGALNIRPSVALLAEANYRLNTVARYPDYRNGIHRPVFGFGIQKASASRRHAFSLVFTNGPGTTFSQRSMTNGLLFGNDGFQGLTIGFNLTRRLF